MRRCPECGAPVDATTQWCGHCGHHFAATMADGSGSDQSSPWMRSPAVIAGAVVVLAVAAVVAWPVDEAAVDRPAGLAVAWEVAAGSDPLDSPITVLPAGQDHVTVGRADGTVLGTRPAVTRDPGLRRLPAALRAAPLSPDGTWAVAEGGRVVRGEVASGRATSARDIGHDGWVPSGPAVAWRGELAVFSGTAGRLGAVDDDGEVVWTTDRPVDPTGPLGDRWLVGTAAVAVHLEGGAVLEFGGGAPVAIAGDVAVATDGDHTAAIRLPSRTPAWERANDGPATWTATTDGLVEQVGTDAHLVDPATGERIASLVGPPEQVPVAGGVVQHHTGRLVARSWDGEQLEQRWAITLEEPFPRRLVRVDDQRVAVVTSLPGADQVRVHAADDGRELAAATVDDGSRVGLVVGDGLIGVTGDALPPVRGPTWIDPVTGEHVAAPGVAVEGLADQDLATGIDLGSVSLTREPFASEGDPFGLLPGQLVAVDPDDGAIRWRVPALAGQGAGHVVGRAESEFGPVVVEAGTAVLQGRFLASGALAWNVSAGAPLSTVPVLTGSRVVVPLADGSLAARDPARGLEVWLTQLGAVPTALAAGDGRVWVGTGDGRVVVLDSLGRQQASVVVGEAPVGAVVAVAGVGAAAVGDRVIGLTLVE